MSLTVAMLRQVLAELAVRRGDSSTYEVKRASGGLPVSIGETLCAFANMPDGGVIILGVDERDGFEITGVTDAAKLEEGIVDIARTAVSPAPRVKVETLIVEGRSVVVAEVTPLRAVDKPAEYQGRAYLRQADGDYVMHEHELRMLEVDKLHAAEQVEYDLMPVPGLTVEDLVPELVTSYLAQVRRADRRLNHRTDEEILRRTSVVTAAGAPTLAGLYAMGDYPQGSFPALTVTAAVQVQRETGNRNKALQHFTGPIPVLLDELMDWVAQNVSSVRRYRADGHMVEESVLPLRGARELLANALVHRDLGPHTLGTGQSIQVRLTSSALMVLSPGGLRGVSLGQVLGNDHAQAAVNQRLYGMCKKLQTDDGAFVIEGEGGGIAEVFAAAQEHSLPRPQLINTGVSFKALLMLPMTAWGSTSVPMAFVEEKENEAAPSAPRPPVMSVAGGRNVTKFGPELSELLRGGGGGGLTLNQLVEGTGLSESQVRYALKKLIASGDVGREGGPGKPTRYWAS